jgi:hypothetical protein
LGGTGSSAFFQPPPLAGSGLAVFSFATAWCSVARVCAVEKREHEVHTRSVTRTRTFAALDGTALLPDALQVLGKGIDQLLAHHLLRRGRPAVRNNACALVSALSHKRSRVHSVRCVYLFWVDGRTSIDFFSLVATGLRMVGFLFLFSTSMCMPCLCLIVPCSPFPRINKQQSNV